jgi:hypothetical protein
MHVPSRPPQRAPEAGDRIDNCMRPKSNHAEFNRRAPVLRRPKRLVALPQLLSRLPLLTRCKKVCSFAGSRVPVGEKPESVIRLIESASLRRNRGGFDEHDRRLRRPDVIAVAVDHAGTELREFRIDQRGARVMWGDAAMFWREAKGDGDIELGQGIDLPVEPGERVRAEAVGP